MIKLKDLCSKGSSNIAQKDLDSCEGKYPIYGAAGLIKKVDFYHQDKPYIAIVKDGAGVGRVMRLPANSSVIGTMQYIIPYEGVNVSYLAYAMEYMNLAKYYLGAAIPHIYFKDYCNEELPAHTTEEQNKIATSLDKVTKLITMCKEQLTKLDELVKSRFIELFGDIHEPSKWDKKPWSEVVTIQNGRDYKNIIVESGGYPVYGTGGEMARASDYLCPENTIIVGRKGTINNPLLVKEKFWNVDTAFGVIVGNQLHYQYFYNFCRMFDFSTLNKQAVLPSTTKADLLKIEIAVPPMELQEQFANFVEQTDKSKFVIKKSLEELETLKKSLMQKYFG